MDVILHLGAHRTGTTSFQTYLRAHRAALTAQGIGFWGPWRTRDGLLQDAARRDAAPDAGLRLRRARDVAARAGLRALVVSDENMLGTTRQCLRAGRLYPGAGWRVARLAAALGGVDRLVLSPRALDAWWGSALALLIDRGAPLPDAAQIAALARAPRSWRAVIRDLARACPEAEVCVTPFADFGARPDRLLQVMTGAPAVPAASPGTFWQNRGPELPALRARLAARGEAPAGLPAGEGRYTPFSAAQTTQLQETWADDLFWLRAGADGLARLADDTIPGAPHSARAAAQNERGHDDDRPARRLAQDR